MRKLLFIIVLFFSTSVLAGGKWVQIPFSLTDLLNENYKIIDQYSINNHRNYLLKKNRERIILCSLQHLPEPIAEVMFTRCYIEEVDKQFIKSD